MSALTFAFAPAGAICFGLGQALQKRRAVVLPRLGLASPDAARSFVMDPIWLAATAMLLVGWVLEFLALRIEPAALVFPCNVLALAVLAWVGVRWLGERLRPREWLGIATCGMGIALGGVSADLAPASTPGVPRPVALATTLALLAAGVGLALWRSRGRRSKGEGPLAVGAGLLFAATGLLTKTLASVQGPGAAGRILPIVAALVALSSAALLVTQAAFQRGRAIVVVAVSGVLADFLPAALGAPVFAESWPTGAAGLWRSLALVTLLAGFLLLLRPAAALQSGDRR